MTNESARLPEAVAEAFDDHQPAQRAREASPLLHRYMLFVGVAGNGWPYFQAAKIINQGSAEEISITANAIVLWALASWLVYGIAIRNWVLIAANIVGVAGAGFLLLTALIYQ